MVNWTLFETTEDYHKKLIGCAQHLMYAEKTSNVVWPEWKWNIFRVAALKGTRRRYAVKNNPVKGALLYVGVQEMSSKESLRYYSSRRARISSTQASISTVLDITYTVYNRSIASRGKAILQTTQWRP